MIEKNLMDTTITMSPEQKRAELRGIITRVRDRMISAGKEGNFQLFDKVAEFAESFRKRHPTEEGHFLLLFDLSGNSEDTALNRFPADTPLDTPDSEIERFIRSL